MLGPEAQPEADLGGTHAVDSTFPKARTSVVLITKDTNGHLTQTANALLMH